MASNYTEHYGLCQWEATDQVLREEFNEDNIKVDEALKTLADENITLESAVAAVAAAAGNCEVYVTSYVGNDTFGESNPNTLTFPAKPVLVMIAGSDILGFTTCNFQSMICIRAGSSSYCQVSWSQDGKTMSWFSRDGIEKQLNSSLRTYPVTIWTMKE